MAANTQGSPAPSERSLSVSELRHDSSLDGPMRVRMEKFSDEVCAATICLQQCTVDTFASQVGPCLKVVTCYAHPYVYR
jgi:hypothetical protein